MHHIFNPRTLPKTSLFPCLRHRLHQVTERSPVKLADRCREIFYRMTATFDVKPLKDLTGQLFYSNLC